MFPPALRTVALVPPGTQVADPVNDLKLLGEARDHFWVELDSGGGFQAADPTFASAQIGQVLTTATQTFAEVPDELRHKVVVRLMRELTSQATALFGIPGQDLAPVIDQVVRTVEVVGRPLSIGHIVESNGIGAIFTAVTNTYSPYMVVGGNALDPSRDGVIRGQDYQEVLTNFPLGSQILTGLFLELDVVAPDGTTRNYRRTIADRIGIAARRHGGTGAATINPQAPFLVSPFDITTISIMPGPYDPSVLTSATAQLAVLQKAALEFQAQVAATSPGPAQTLFAPRANDVMRDGDGRDGAIAPAGVRLDLRRVHGGHGALHEGRGLLRQPADQHLPDARGVLAGRIALVQLRDRPAQERHPRAGGARPERGGADQLQSDPRLHGHQVRDARGRHAAAGRRAGTRRRR